MKIKDAAEYGLFCVGTWLLRALPLEWSRVLLERAGRLAVRRRWWRADVAASQLAAALPDLAPGEREQLLADLYRNLARTVHEVFISPPDPGQVRVSGGWAPLDAALARGRGLILASVHLGNFELCGRVIAGRCDLLDVVKPQRNRLFDRYLEIMRNRGGIATVPMAKSGPAVLKHLRAGGVVSLLLDQDAGDRGVVVPFLGRPAATWPGAARLSLQTGCPVLPVCLARRPDGGHDLEFGDLMEPDKLPPEARDPVAYTALITERLEEFVRRHPQQWFWVHRRWKGAATAHKETAGSG